MGRTDNQLHLHTHTNSHQSILNKIILPKLLNAICYVFKQRLQKHFSKTELLEVSEPIEVKSISQTQLKTYIP
jgi:hypothetical protein